MIAALGLEPAKTAPHPSPQQSKTPEKLRALSPLARGPPTNDVAAELREKQEAEERARAQIAEAVARGYPMGSQDIATAYLGEQAAAKAAVEPKVTFGERLGKGDRDEDKALQKALKESRVDQCSVGGSDGSNEDSNGSERAAREEFLAGLPEEEKQ